MRVKWLACKGLSMTVEVKLYSTQFCPYCIRAKQLLSQKDVEFVDIPVDQNPLLRTRMMEASGRQTVPQIWINGRHVGGFDDLWSLEQRGQLDTLLQATEAVNQMEKENG